MSFWSQRRDDSPTKPQTSPASPAKPAASPPARQPAKQPETSRQAVAQKSAPTVIAAGSTVVGEVTGDTDLIIHGVLRGEIDLQSHVLVGADGKVEGDILASAIEIAGTVHGNVHCDGLLKVQASGSLEGEVAAVDMDVDKGCFLSGRVQRIKAGQPRPKRGSKSGGGGASQDKKAPQAKPPQTAQKPPAAKPQETAQATGTDGVKPSSPQASKPANAPTDQSSEMANDSDGGAEIQDGRNAHQRRRGGGRRNSPRRP